MSHRVSIILPTFNELGYLRRSIASVLAQTDPDWELVVVDDGSIDGSADHVEALRDPRISVLRSTHTGSPGALRNLGADRSKAEYLAFLDTDDVWMPTKLEEQLSALDRAPGFGWSYTAVERIYANGDPMPPGGAKPWRRLSGWILHELLTIDARVATPTVVIRRRLFTEVGGYDPSMGIEDYDLYFRLAVRAQALCLPRPLSRVRSRPGSYQSDRVWANAAWVRAYEKASSWLEDPQARRLCRQGADRHRVLQAWHLAREGRRDQALTLLAKSLPSGLGSSRFWRTLFRTVVPVRPQDQAGPPGRPGG